MAAKSMLLVITVLVVVIDNCHGLSCPCWKKPREDPTRCSTKQPPACQPGKQLVHDACGCCLVCSQGMNENCGGPWKAAGTCSTGLECQDKQTGTVLTANAMNPFGTKIGTCNSPRRTETPSYPQNPYYPPWTYYWAQGSSAEDRGTSMEHARRI
eukprot:XP_011663210.1 PREDICTED: single insulin-like growth factor-binding domain protein-2 isoform X1 [Strongylocentrotus purpuratus]